MGLFASFPEATLQLRYVSGQHGSHDVSWKQLSGRLKIHKFNNPNPNPNICESFARIAASQKFLGRAPASPARTPMKTLNWKTTLTNS